MSAKMVFTPRFLPIFSKFIGLPVTTFVNLLTLVCCEEHVLYHNFICSAALLAAEMDGTSHT